MSNISMEARIELETRDLKPKEVRELILDNCRSATIEGLTDQYEELEVLSMINLGLTTLKGFPAYPKLRSLELSDNKLIGDMEYLKGCPNIASLKICNNRIDGLTALEPLKLLSNLISLDLIECPIADSDSYREDVLTAIPQLTFLDGIDREGNAEPDSDEDYEFDEDQEGDLGTDEDVDSEEEGDEADREGANDEDEGEDDEEAVDGEAEKAVVGEEEAVVGEEKAVVDEEKAVVGEEKAVVEEEEEVEDAVVSEEEEEVEDHQPAAKRVKLDAVVELESNPDSNGVEEVNDSNS